MANKVVKASRSSKTKSVSRKTCISVVKNPKARSSKQPAKKRTIADSAAQSMCVRCRVLNTSCDHRMPQCTSCTNASKVCFYFQATINDKLFNNLPQNPSLGNRTSNRAGALAANQWMRLQASDEFLEVGPVNDTASDAHIPEDTSSLTENPFRDQSESTLASALSGPLEKVIQKYPDGSAVEMQRRARLLTEQVESPSLPLPLPLPSSDLLDCINRSIAQKEALETQPRRSLLNERLNGSSLLALGILLQEQCKYFL